MCARWHGRREPAREDCQATWLNLRAPGTGTHDLQRGQVASGACQTVPSLHTPVIPPSQPRHAEFQPNESVVSSGVAQQRADQPSAEASGAQSELQLGFAAGVAGVAGRCRTPEVGRSSSSGPSAPSTVRASASTIIE